MPPSRQVPNNETAKYRVSLADVCWALFMVAWAAFGIVMMARDVEEYRWQQRMIADFNARMPKVVVEIPYDPAVGERLIGEAAGCVITIAVVLFGIRRRRHGAVEVRVKWLPAARPRSVSAQATRTRAAPRLISPQATTPARVSPPVHRPNSGALAADRLSAIVWNDHVARHLEKETA